MINNHLTISQHDDFKEHHNQLHCNVFSSPSMILQRHKKLPITAQTNKHAKCLISIVVINMNHVLVHRPIPIMINNAKYNSIICMQPMTSNQQQKQA